jgi:hypothetical protein
MYKKYFILVVNLLNYRFWAIKNYRFAFRLWRNKKNWLMPHSGIRCGACPPLEDNGEPLFAFAKGGD